MLFFLISLTSLVFADSFITSITFWERYNSSLNRKEAYTTSMLWAPPELNFKDMRFLIKSSNRLEEKIALINSLSSNSLDKRTSNSDVFLKFLGQKHNKELSFSNASKYCKAEEIFLLAYMRSLDNYSDINTPLKMINHIRDKKLKKSLTFNIIRSLITIQSKLNNADGWCEMDSIYKKITTNPYLQKDIKKDTVNRIGELIKSYSMSCRQNGSFNLQKNSYKERTRVDFIPYDQAPKPIIPIHANLVYPEEARAAGIEGKVVIRFFINSSGNVDANSLEIINSVPGLDEAAMDAVIKSKWIPARHRNQKIGIPLVIPLDFKLTD